MDQVQRVVGLDPGHQIAADDLGHDRPDERSVEVDLVPIPRDIAGLATGLVEDDGELVRRVDRGCNVQHSSLCLPVPTRRAVDLDSQSWLDAEVPVLDLELLLMANNVERPTLSLLGGGQLMKSVH